jgi:hypothetical protein
MSDDIHTQRRWLIAGVAILVVILLLVLFAIFRSVQPRDSRPLLGHRSPAARLAYCSPGDSGLCIVSFGQIVGGDMLVNFQIPRLAYPEFSLIINRYGVESVYQCKKVKGLSTGVTCTGPSQVPGEVLLFKVISTKDGGLLAAGSFSIIGIALSTPEGGPTDTETPLATEPPATETEMPTMTAIPLLPTVTPGTPTVSYPPPSYPNPTAYP